MTQQNLREFVLETPFGRIRGLENDETREFRGIPFAHAARFQYGVPAERYDGELDATKFGPACPQNRAWHEHFEHPTRLFYHKEFRDGMTFDYDEDCLNLNLYAPRNAKGAPVIVFFYGGGFDSGLNCESPFDGTELAKRGVITVFSNYRVGILGYMTHEEIFKENGRDGNFGLDDELLAIRWVKSHIEAFGGDPENITIMGQSAGAMAVQYLSLNPEYKGLFSRAVMLSGAGLFPKFSLPKPAAERRPYWEQFIEVSGCGDFEGLKNASLDTIFDTVEKMKDIRKDAIYHTMPVIDGALIPAPIDSVIKHALDLDYWVSYTNTDMYAPILAYIGNRFANYHRGKAHVLYFDLDAPGDENKAFHSADVRYVFGTLDRSWRPYGDRDYAVSRELMDRLAAFAKTGDPNVEGLAEWPAVRKGLRTNVLRIDKNGEKTGHTPYFTLLRNWLTKGDPKA